LRTAGADGVVAAGREDIEEERIHPADVVPRIKKRNPMIQ
jgi:hypothetical protein